MYGFKTYRYYLGLWWLCMEQKCVPLLLYGVWLWYAARVCTLVCIWFVICVAWVYRYITAPQLRMILLLEFLNFSMYVVPYDWTA